MMFLNRLKSFILKKRISMEGGGFFSKSARIHTKKNYNVDVGLFSYGGCFDPEFNTGGKVLIGRYCSIAQHVHYFGANHPLKGSIMSPFFYNPQLGFDVKDVQRSNLEIGNDVWIGTNVVITHSCHTIGNGAVVGAGTIVTKDVPPYAVVLGNPGKICYFRFDNLTIEMLEKSRWWELSPKELMEFYPLMDNPNNFASAVIDWKSKHFVGG